MAERGRKTTPSTVVLLMVGAALVVLLATIDHERLYHGLRWWFFGADEIAAAGSEGADDEVAYYTCSMDPSVQADAPGRCPLCGMDLTPVTTHERGSNVLHLDPERMRWIGVRFDEAERRRLRSTIPARGRVVSAAPNPPDGPDAEPTSPVELDARADDVDPERLYVGQAVMVGVPSAPLTRLMGSITAIGPSSSPSERTAALRVSVDDRGALLRLGEEPELWIDVDFGEHLLVDEDAILPYGDARIAFVELGPGRLQARRVSTGVAADGLVEVLDGVAPGERVVSAGLFFVAAESRVRSAAIWDEAIMHHHMPRRAEPDGSAPSGSVEGEADPRPETTRSPEPAPPVYTCPMHPDVQHDAPGDCPICHMHLRAAAPSSP